MSSSSVSKNVAGPHMRMHRRRQSTPAAGARPRKQEMICQPMPYSLEALDLRTTSPKLTLASLRILVLSYLEHLEGRLSELSTPALEAWREKSGHTMDESSQWATTALEMLDSIRTDVYSHLPELSVETVKSHLPDLPDVPTIDEMYSHLPDMPDIAHFLPGIGSTIDDVKDRLHDLDISFIPVLSTHLDDLQSHLKAMDFPAGAEHSYHTLTSVLSDIMDALSPPADISSSFREAEKMIEKATTDIASAVKRSFEGARLITYHDLPPAWRNNPFVTQGYRFIPIERWPLILASLFALHNETLNIYTHLVPFVLWTLRSIPYINPSALDDTPEALFMIFALACLFCSTVWHTMAGCAHHESMDFCARADYVGIGWLISVSVGTVVHFGFQCHPTLKTAFLSLCLFTGVAGSICPFMSWFNNVKYRYWRIAFFLALAFSAIGPLAMLSVLHSPREMSNFIAPVVPSLVSYITGLVFYATHCPERFLPARVNKALDSVGGGSHCIWHCFIVLAVSQHKAAIPLMKNGIGLQGGECGVGEVMML